MTDRSDRHAFAALGKGCFLRYGQIVAAQELWIAHGRLTLHRRVSEHSYEDKEEPLCTFDIRQRDPDYWHSVKLFLLWLGSGTGIGDWSTRAYKALRRQHVDARRREWEDVLPDNIGRWALGVIRREAAGESCVDNARVALMSNTAQMRRYRAQKAAGCCGFYDAVHVGPDGHRYLIGFNYGH